MSSSRRARPFAEDFYREEQAGQAAEWTGPHAPDDRPYLMLVYQEHASLARQQEYLRAAWSAALVGLGTLLLLVAQDESRQRICGLLLVSVGAIGALALSKHYGRYKLHLRMMRAFRHELADTVRADISRLTTVVRVQHGREHRLLGWVSLHGVFVLLALAMVGGGGEMVWRSVEVSAALASAANAPQLKPELASERSQYPSQP